MLKAVIHVGMLLVLLQMLMKAWQAQQLDLVFGSYSRNSRPRSFWAGWLMLAVVALGSAWVVWSDWP
jgi:hypothetical protein